MCYRLRITCWTSLGLGLTWYVEIQQIIIRGSCSHALSKLAHNNVRQSGSPGRASGAGLWVWNVGFRASNCIVPLEVDRIWIWVNYTKIPI